MKLDSASLKTKLMLEIQTWITDLSYMVSKCMTSRRKTSDSRFMMWSTLKAGSLTLATRPLFSQTSTFRWISSLHRKMSMAWETARQNLNLSPVLSICGHPANLRSLMMERAAPDSQGSTPSWCLKANRAEDLWGFSLETAPPWLQY